MRLLFNEKSIVMAMIPYVCQQYGLESPVTFDYKFRSEHNNDGPPKFFVEIDFKCGPSVGEVIPDARPIAVCPSQAQLEKEAAQLEAMQGLMAGTDQLPGYDGQATEQVKDVLNGQKP